jgi:hypothetical protein
MKQLQVRLLFSKFIIYNVLNWYNIFIIIIVVIIIADSSRLRIIYLFIYFKLIDADNKKI